VKGLIGRVGEIDDLEATMAKGDIIPDENPLCIGAPMTHQTAHGYDVLFSDRPAPPVDYAANAAHIW